MRALIRRLIRWLTADRSYLPPPVPDSRDTLSKWWAIQGRMR